jgi:hypothetical protein
VTFDEGSLLIQSLAQIQKTHMKKSIATRYLVFAAVLFALMIPMASVVLRADDKAPATASTSNLAKDLQGTWVLVGKPGEAEETPGKGARLKFITGKHWTITQADPETGVTVYHHGGTYTLKDDEYVETVEYANESTKEIIKQTFNFTMKVEGDKLTQTGIGNPFNEVWKRAK